MLHKVYKVFTISGQKNINTFQVVLYEDNIQSVTSLYCILTLLEFLNMLIKVLSHSLETGELTK